MNVAAARPGTRAARRRHRPDLRRARPDDPPDDRVRAGAGLARGQPRDRRQRRRARPSAPRCARGLARHVLLAASARQRGPERRREGGQPQRGARIPAGAAWRREALEEIGGFPTWNLVEDLQSGVEALRRGWRGQYLPIVGAAPQHSPHDVPNFYKQRGTWCVDTVRLVVRGDLKGLNVRQRLQFLELLFFYLASFTVPVYLVALAGALLGFPPIAAGALGFVAHLLPMVVATELWLFVLNQPFNDPRSRQRTPYRDLWKVRTMWVGLSPVFMKATVQAIIGGPHRKPVYRVTLENDDVRWHWRHTLPQTVLVAAVVTVVVYASRFGTYPSVTLLVGSIYWGALNVIFLGNFIARGWHGVASASAFLRRRERRASAATSASG